MTSSNISVDFIEIINTLAPQWFNNRIVNLINLVGLAMSTVEKYSSEVEKLSSSDKFNTAIAIFPLVLDTLVKLNILTQNQADSYKKQTELIQTTINDIAKLTNDPNWIQGGKWIKANVKKHKCPIKCLRKNN